MENGLKQVFDSYVNSVALDESKKTRLISHSYGVMELSKEIALSLNNLSDEDLFIVELIGLFHDIGKIANYNGVDHGGDAITVLFDQGLIQKLNAKFEYYDIIKMAIYHHNKYQIPDYLDEKTKIFCNILRDADKVETFKKFSEGELDIKTYINEYPSVKVYNDFKNYKTVDRNNLENKSDEIICVLGYLFGINYKYSSVVIKEKKYLETIFSKFKYENEELKTFFISIGSALNNYLNKKVGGENVG